tara:strand:- start:228 stop:740 length:513 start_codon:yes stop_codon:yes gene_type:complete
MIYPEKDYLEQLLSSKTTVFMDEISKFNIKDSGLYILQPCFNLEKITGEIYLKVGMTVGKTGLKGRLATHFSNSLRLHDGKLKSPTVLSRHMYFDRTLSKELGLDFTIHSDRRKFLREHCYFQVLPLKEFNWASPEEKRLKRRGLKKIESLQIESKVRSKTRYIDDIIER